MNRRHLFKFLGSLPVVGPALLKAGLIKPEPVTITFVPPKGMLHGVSILEASGASKDGYTSFDLHFNPGPRCHVCGSEDVIGSVTYSQSTNDPHEFDVWARYHCAMHATVTITPEV